MHACKHVTSPKQQGINSVRQPNLHCCYTYLYHSSMYRIKYILIHFSEQITIGITHIWDIPAHFQWYVYNSIHGAVAHGSVTDYSFPSA